MYFMILFPVSSLHIYLIAHLILLSSQIFLQILPGNPYNALKGFTQMELSCAVRGYDGARRSTEEMICRKRVRLSNI